MHVIFLFIDGVGLGPAGKNNPFTPNSYSAFKRMSGGQSFTNDAKPIKKDNHFFAPVDANLGVEGLPQSGTGQTALFSGENAAKLIGKHFGPWPHSGVAHLLEEESVFNKARALGKTVHFINAYPEIFFQKAKKRGRWTGTTLLARGAQTRLNGPEQVKKGRAVTAGIIQKAWKEQLKIDVPIISPQTGGRRLLKESQKYDLLLHEYYLTDKAGHSQNQEAAKRNLNIYNDFLETIIAEKPAETTIVLSSDHGNIENLSTKTHTRNKVPLFVCGPGAKAFFKATSILDVTPKIIKVLAD
ncbi:MAG TPA: hypothetical protein VK106_02355 [Balneolaceae bacterium]|nr:hypothetical protein [Balneolaceae bacterium]